MCLKVPVLVGGRFSEYEWCPERLPYLCRHNAQVHDTQHTGERAGSSGEQGASEGAGQAGGNGQARHEAGQAISKNNLTTEERSPGTMRTNQHELDDDATQSTSTAIT